MNKHIFTFGSNHLYEGFYQPIFAEDRIVARAKMIETYGLKWSHQYTEEEWNEIIKNRYVLNWERPLEPIYCNS